MAGGLIEGLQKCFTGKNLFKKHLFLFVLTMLIAIPATISTVATKGDDTAVYKYMFINFPILGILSLVCSFILGLYMIHFIHNSIKFFLWSDTQEDKERVKALQIMPEINGQIFNKFNKYIGFSILWLIMLSVMFFILTLLCSIPGLGLLFIPFMLLSILAAAFSMPYVFCGFAKNYKFQGNISPLLIFTYIPKIFLPTLILILKFIVMYIVYIIVIMVIMFILGLTVGLLGLDMTNNIPLLTITTTLITYLALIISLAYYYAIAKIYYDKVELNKEI